MSSAFKSNKNHNQNNSFHEFYGYPLPEWSKMTESPLKKKNNNNNNKLQHLQGALYWKKKETIKGAGQEEDNK